MSVVNSSRYWGGIVCPDPHSLLGFGLAWACIGFVYTIATTVSSLWAATLLCPAGNVSCSYLLPLHLDSFCLLFYNDPFSLGGRLYVLYLQDWAFCISYPFHRGQLWVIVLNIICCTLMLFKWGMEMHWSMNITISQWRQIMERTYTDTVEGSYYLFVPSLWDQSDNGISFFDLVQLLWVSYSPINGLIISGKKETVTRPHRKGEFESKII